MGKQGRNLIMTLGLTVWGAAIAQAQSGPVGYWKGDDGASPATAADSSGNGNPGQYVNGANTSTNVPTLQFTNPTSMIFDGVDDQVRNTTFAWPTGGPVTVAFWNNVATADVRNSSAFSVGSLDNANRFHVHAPWSDSTLYWDYGDIGANGRISTPYTAYLNKWTHVALVSEGVGGAFKAIYLDGVLAASGTVTNGPTQALTGVTIGTWNTLWHKGLIDDFRIYNRVLTAAQIQMLAAGQTEPAAPTLTATAGNGQVMLSWTPVTGATSYNLKRSNMPGGPYAIIQPATTATNYTDTGLTNGNTYYYVVSAIGLGEGPNSTEQSATPLGPPRISGDHEEGIFGDRCDCGTAAPAPWGWALLAPALAAWALRRRRP